MWDRGIAGYTKLAMRYEISSMRQMILLSNPNSNIFLIEEPHKAKCHSDLRNNFWTLIYVTGCPRRHRNVADISSTIDSY